MTKPVILPWQVIDAVAAYHKVKPALVVGPRRFAHLFRARMMITVILRDDLSLSWPRIGQYLGGRDHASAMHAYKRAQQERERDSLFEPELTFVRKLLELGVPANVIH